MVKENIEIQVEVIEEAGFKASMFGISLNKDQPVENMSRVANKLAPLDLGHNKFLEQMMIWMLVRAPRYLWQEMDTFRLSSKSSQSTMHTILNNELTEKNFECEEIDINYLAKLNETLKKGELVKLKRKVPEGFMQKRMWMMSYKTLRNIILQRRFHRLPHWKAFLTDVIENVEHPELLPSLEMRQINCDLCINAVPKKCFSCGKFGDYKNYEEEYVNSI